MELTKSERQELKDKLWRLDDDIENQLAAIARATGEAWKAAVEHHDHAKHLLHAQNLARDLWERIQATVVDLGVG